MSVSRRGPSSVSKVIGSGAAPLSDGGLTVRGTISSLKRPASMAATAFWCEASAKASVCSRSMPYFCASRSAVRPMPR